MSVTTRPPATEVRGRAQLLGRVTVVGGLLGAASAAVIIGWPDQVGEARFSHPFDTRSYVVAQVFFAVQHLALLAGLVALLPLVAGSSRATRAGTWLAVAGMVGLSACELVALAAADVAATSSTGAAVSAAYGLPTTLLGLGLTVAGVGLARRPVLRGADRWVVLVLGVYVFVVLLPGLFGSLVVGRLVIGTWMLLFAWLGVALVRHQPATGGAS